MTPLFIYHRPGLGYIVRELGDQVDTPPAGDKLVASIESKAWVQNLINSPTFLQLKMIIELQKGENK